mmetsp:Transcript_45636/g.108888  ORF Transcript_45636/g.108888 Transcript_45636/m.108888 type:complete len:246 (-) Transcript_45636:742-1479(-)
MAGVLGQLHAFQQLGEVIAPRVGLFHFEHLDGVVSEEELNNEGPLVDNPVRRPLVPRAVKPQHLAVVGQVFGDGLLLVLALAEQRFVVVGHVVALSAVVGARDFPILRSAGRADDLAPVRLVARDRLLGTHVHASAREEFPREIVALGDAEGAVVETEVPRDADVAPVDRLSVLPRRLVPLEKVPLEDARVLLARLRDLERVVLQVIGDHAPAHAVALDARLLHRLLEIRLKVEHLLVQRDPLRD